MTIAPELDGFEHDRAGWSGAGAHAGTVDLLTLHTTEGPPGSAAGAIATLHANRSESHVVVEHRAAARGGRRRVQLVALDRAAKSLRNLAGGGETNRGGTLQIELVGYASTPANATADDWLWLGEYVVGPMCRAAGIPIVAPLKFHPYPPPGYRLGAEPWRTLDATDNVRGIVGHQHWRENVHGDPGDLSAKLYRNGTASPIELIIQGATGAANPGEFTMTPDEAKLIRTIVRQEVDAALEEVVNPDGKGNLLTRIRNAVATIGPRTEETVTGIRTLLGR